MDTDELLRWAKYINVKRLIIKKEGLNKEKKANTDKLPRNRETVLRFGLNQTFSLKVGKGQWYLYFVLKNRVLRTDKKPQVGIWLESDWKKLEIFL